MAERLNRTKILSAKLESTMALPRVSGPHIDRLLLFLLCSYSTLIYSHPLCSSSVWSSVYSIHVRSSLHIMAIVVATRKHPPQENSSWVLLLYAPRTEIVDGRVAASPPSPIMLLSHAPFLFFHASTLSALVAVNGASD